MRPIAPNTFKRRLADRSTCQLGYWLSLNSIALTEIAAGAGFDWLLLDMEHASYDLESVDKHLLAARHGGDAEFVVRVPAIDASLIKRLMDAGVRSFMFPYVQTVAEAELAVAATRYPPRGIRGYSGITRANRFASQPGYAAHADEDVVVILQVETVEGLDNIPAYGAIDGVDGIFVGPNDLAASMGLLGQSGHADVLAEVARARKAILATGKGAGMLDFNPEAANRLMADGFTFVAVGGDATSMVRATKELLGRFGR
jgi:4-hydroxy-2-oxoheptanedioate aldolase